MIGSVTPIGDTHFHVCERCGELWCHTKAKVTPEERERIHRCPLCASGPYIMAYETRRDANEVRRFVRLANNDAINNATAAASA